MVRTVAVFAFPAALIALAWLRLEETRAAGADGLWVVLLALAPALAPTIALRIALTVPAALTAAWVALDTPVARRPHGFFGPVLDRFGDGFLDYYDVTVPFSGVEQPNMHGVLVLGVFGFCLVLAHALAARRPLPAVFAVIAGAGWPATLYPSQSVAYGALILAAALFVLAGLRTTRPAPALVAGAVLVRRRGGASTSAALAKDGVLAWERWDAERDPRPGLGRLRLGRELRRDPVPEEEDDRAARLRAEARLLLARDDARPVRRATAGCEAPTPLSTGPPTGRLPDRPAAAGALAEPAHVGEAGRRGGRAPRRARDRRGAAGRARRPAARERVPALGRDRAASEAASRAVSATRSGATRRGPSRPSSRASRPSIRADARPLPRPRPRLASSRSALPAATRASTRSSTTSATSRSGPTSSSGTRRAGCGRGRRTPYGAVVAIETWLRSTGGFAYDESPPATGGLPPLAHFVAEGKRGYCQHFAGAMALMLRFLGIPARVAAGFTSGKPEDGGWTVTDHNAHAWVEVWFPDYGWLAFDPTPGRGTLAAVQRLLGRPSTQATRPRRSGRPARRQCRRRRRARAARPAEGAAGGAERAPAAAAAAASGGRSALWALLLVALAAGVGDRHREARPPSPALPDARSAPARGGRAARARRLPGRPGRRRQVERDARRAARARAVRARRRRKAIRGGGLGSTLRACCGGCRRGAPGPSGAARAAPPIRRGLGRPARLRGLVALRSLRT